MGTKGNRGTCVQSFAPDESKRDKSIPLRFLKKRKLMNEYVRFCHSQDLDGLPLSTKKLGGC